MIGRLLLVIISSLLERRSVVGLLVLMQLDVQFRLLLVLLQEAAVVATVGLYFACVDVHRSVILIVRLRLEGL